ncbi:MAG: PEP-CTERM sorting domain-containing protein [Verrucomicrobia bacterium]|nr:PEP-CTERM sorting domain-containing protein [Verrucomicrobiota bacterium]
MKKTLLILSFSVASACIGYAFTYTADFNNNTLYPNGSDVAGHDNWFITGASSSGGPSLITSSPWVGQGRAAWFGFQPINVGATDSYLYHTWGAPLVGNSLSYSQFGVTMIIVDSNIDYPKRDAFGFTFRDDANQDIFTLTFTPSTQTLDPDSDFRVDNVSWSSNYGAGGAIGTLTEPQFTTLEITFTPGSGNDVTFNVKSAGVQLKTGTLTNAAGLNLNTFGALWTPLDPLDVGANQLVFDNLSLVPEPSSALLGLLGASLVFVRRRRA